MELNVISLYLAVFCVSGLFWNESNGESEDSNSIPSQNKGQRGNSERIPTPPLENIKKNSGPTGVIGGDRTIAYFCVLNNTLAYSCQKDCSGSQDLFTVFPDNKHKVYHNRNCSTPIKLSNSIWNKDGGILPTRFLGIVGSNQLEEVMASCEFYTTSWYECRGVANCKPEWEGTIATCAGAAPWMGEYQGTPENGNLKGNIIHTALHSPSVGAPVEQKLQTEQPIQCDDTTVQKPKERVLVYFCTYYTNFTYSCQTNCSDGEGFIKVFPDDDKMKYNGQNCTNDVQLKSDKWRKEDGIMDAWMDTAKTEIIVLATCSYYDTSLYECAGVADCNHGEGITYCAGAAPWRGYYNGTVIEGNLKGNVTDRAQYSPPPNPLPKPLGVNSRKAGSPSSPDTDSSSTGSLSSASNGKAVNPTSSTAAPLFQHGRKLH